MKRKLKLSTLSIESFVTSEEKRNTIVGGSLPTDTDNPNICINYSNLYVCNTANTTCIHSENPALCFALTNTCANTNNLCISALIDIC